MKLQKRPDNRVSCLPTALAMILDKPVSVVIDGIGHDGMSIDENNKLKRGFIIEDLNLYTIGMGLGVLVPFPLGIAIGEWKYLSPIRHLMFAYTGILVGEPNGYAHGVAWDHDNQLCYDPNGRVYEYPGSEIEKSLEEFWLWMEPSGHKPIGKLSLKSI